MAIRQFQDGVTRIRRAGFHDVRRRMNVAIAGRADAAGIDNQAAVAKPHRARDMAMRAEDQRLRDPDRGRFDRLNRRHPHRLVGK